MHGKRDGEREREKEKEIERERERMNKPGNKIPLKLTETPKPLRWLLTLLKTRQKCSASIWALDSMLTLSEFNWILSNNLANRQWAYTQNANKKNRTKREQKTYKHTTHILSTHSHDPLMQVFLTLHLCVWLVDSKQCMGSFAYAITLNFSLVGLSLHWRWWHSMEPSRLLRRLKRQHISSRR